MSHRKWNNAVQPSAAHSANFSFPVRHPMPPHGIYSTVLSCDPDWLFTLQTSPLFARPPDPPSCFFWIWTEGEREASPPLHWSFTGVTEDRQGKNLPLRVRNSV